MTEPKGFVMAEQVHRYPLWIRLLQELLGAAVVIAALWWAASDLLRWLWGSFGQRTPLLLRFPALAEPLLDWLGPRRAAPLTALLPSLTALLLALLLALIIRNVLPTIRTSARGLLVEFAGDWLPVPWETLTAARVTRGARPERFVLLAETEPRILTGWHRLFTLLYRARLNRGLLISSAISDAEQLVATMLSETDRAVKLFGAARAIRLQEHDTSPIFSLLLGKNTAEPAPPASDRVVPRAAAAPAKIAAPEVIVDPNAVQVSYSKRLRQLIGGLALLLVVVAVLRYLTLLLTGLVLLVPALRQLPLFDLLRPVQGQIAAPWWPPIAAHIALAGLLSLALLIATLLPALEARQAGLAVRHLRRWLVVPWAQVKTLKETELDDAVSLTLIQTSAALPFVRRISSLLYDGSLAPGVPLASFAENAAPLLDRVVTETARHQPPTASLLSAPIVQSDARSDLLTLLIRPGATIDTLTDDARRAAEDQIGGRRLGRALAQMVLLAGLPALLIITIRAVGLAVPPDGRLLGVALLLLLIGLLEWPVAVLTAQVLQERSATGEALGLKPFPLYPLVQLPRALALVGAIALALLGVPLLPTLVWGAAALWSFLLAAGLWESLYGMRGTRLLAIGAVSVGFQVALIIICGLLGLLG